MVNLIGVIYALPKIVLDRILDEKKNVFVKYITFQPTRKSRIKLKKGIKLYLYESKGLRKVVGEAVIKYISFMTYKEILNADYDGLMLTKKELKSYCGKRMERKAMIFLLKGIRRYIKPVVINKNITMGGLYVTKKNIEQLNLKIK